MSNATQSVPLTVPGPVIELTLQRQGVGHFYRRFFAPCPHNHSWHIQVDRHARGTLVELSYPNCHVCYAPPRPAREDYPHRPDHDEAIRAWASRVRSGQVCASNRHTYGQCPDEHAGRLVASRLIQEHVPGHGNAIVLPEVEAYMAYSAASRRVHPHIENDYYETCAVYFPRPPTTDTIHPVIALAVSCQPLVHFDPSTGSAHVHSSVPMDPTRAPLLSILNAALGEFRKEHTQREPVTDSRPWLAWLISEYIREDPSLAPHFPTQRLSTLTMD